jgi:hypothetical protein
MYEVEKRGVIVQCAAGGAGFIASHAALQLLEEGHAVTVFDNLSRGNTGAVLQLSLLAKPDRWANQPSPELIDLRCPLQINTRLQPEHLIAVPWLPGITIEPTALIIMGCLLSQVPLCERGPG